MSNNIRSEVNGLIDEINRLSSLDLEAQATSRFAKVNGSSQQIKASLATIQCNGQMFTNEEKKDIGDSVNRFSPVSAKTINQNLAFLSTQTEDLMMRYKIQLLRECLQVENDSIDIKVNGTEALEELTKLYFQFERAIPKRFEYMVTQYPDRDQREDIRKKMNKLAKWFPAQNNELVLLFLFRYLNKVSPEDLALHFEAYVLREIEQGRLSLNPETQTLNEATFSEILKLLHSFIQAYQAKRTESPAEELATVRTSVKKDKSQKSAARPKGVCFTEEIWEQPYSKEGQPNELKLAPQTKRGHKEHGAELSKDSKAKSVEVEENPFLANIQDQKQFLTKFKQHIEPTFKLDLLMNPSVFDKTGKMVAVDLRETAPEEAAFYEELLSEADKASHFAPRNSEEYRAAAFNIVQTQLNANERLNHPSTFYGKIVQEPRFASYNRAYPISLDSSMRKDEARLHEKYDELLATQDACEPYLTDENLAKLNGWIEREAAISNKMLKSVQAHSEKMIQKYEPLIAALHAIVSIQGERPGNSIMAKKDPNRYGERYEKIKGVVKYYYQELNQREAALLNQPISSKKRLLKQEDLQQERETLTRIIELFSSDKMHAPRMRLFGSVEESLEALREILLGNEPIDIKDPSQIADKETLLHTDLPLYFPERLRDYLAAYQNSRMSERSGKG